jgi:DNA-binding LytR/AlgR family response regulator
VACDGGEALIHKTFRAPAGERDPAVFVQVHRSTTVNLHHVAQGVRGADETADVHLRGRWDVLTVQRGFLHLFEQLVPPCAGNALPA